MEPTTIVGIAVVVAFVIVIGLKLLRKRNLNSGPGGKPTNPSNVDKV